ncbi:DUF2559 family protein [Pantoea sp. Eser]|nr:DUF2559 family protein [Pantoea sp. Eser]
MLSVRGRSGFPLRSLLRVSTMKKRHDRLVAKRAEEIYEATKVMNFAASSLLEGIRISPVPALSTLDQVRRRYKQ